MYSVLIVDDEEPVLESYAFLVASLDDAFTVCGTARTGREALLRAHETRPDIILMDIAMPGIDGLDTIKEMQRELPESLYILSTAYERFDLAQRAIPLRVFAYLVKPVSRARFLETILRAKDALDERSASRSQRLDEVETNTAVIAGYERELLTRISWKPLSERAWEQYRHLFQVEAEYGQVVAVSGPDRTSYERIVHALELRTRCLSTVFLRRLVLLVLAPIDTTVLERVIRDADRDARIGIGTRRPYTEWHVSYDEAMVAIQDGEYSADESGAEWDALHRVRREVARRGSVEHVQEAMNRYAEELFAAHPFPAAMARIVALIALVTDTFAARNGIQAPVEQFGTVLDELSALETRAEWDAWLARAVPRLFGQLAAPDRSHWPPVLQRVVHMIEARYAEPFQLASLAEECEVSAGHLSRLFNEFLGTTFNDFLNRVRLDAADTLLRENRLTIKEIAYATGYHDPNYFSRIFKRFRGVSPREFIEGAHAGET